MKKHKREKSFTHLFSRTVGIRKSFNELMLQPVALLLDLAAQPVEGEVGVVARDDLLSPDF
jgi:hypothetical protein